MCALRKSWWRSARIPWKSESVGLRPSKSTWIAWNCEIVVTLLGKISQKFYLIACVGIRVISFEFWIWGIHFILFHGFDYFLFVGGHLFVFWKIKEPCTPVIAECEWNCCFCKCAFSIGNFTSGEILKVWSWLWANWGFCYLFFSWNFNGFCRHICSNDHGKETKQVKNKNIFRKKN